MTHMKFSGDFEERLRTADFYPLDTGLQITSNEHILPLDTRTCMSAYQEVRNVSLASSKRLTYVQFSGVQGVRITAHKMKFSIKVFCSIWSHLLKKSLMENFIFVQ